MRETKNRKFFDAFVFQEKKTNERKTNNNSNRKFILSITQILILLIGIFAFYMKVLI